MKKWFFGFVVAILCIIIAAETLYIVIFPCTWGYSVYVDAILVGSLKDQDQLLELLEDIKEPYITPNTQSCEFLEDVKIQKEKFLKEQLMTSTAEQIASKLTKNRAEEKQYTFRMGDTWADVAEKHGLTSRELLSMNPGKNINQLKAGETIVIARAIPFISVVTTEQRTYEEEIPYEVVYLNNEKEHTVFDYSRIVQPGICGTAEVTANITYVNGLETNREILSSSIVVEPVNQVEEVIH